ncbi:MAG: carbon storage regulator CsrA [Spirochaetes bacterium]|nr:carbon storage regulator CsrA [Spirochaetota bacterium]MBU1079455.1 carbon storage regulator CsrA [Spirochaetota bacterium]
MLILSRKLNEKVVIGDGVVVSVIEIRGDQVKLGIDAPKSVKVFRQEVYDAIQAENRLAAGSALQLPSLDITPRG